MKYEALQRRVAQLEADLAAARVENAELAEALEFATRQASTLGLEAAALRPLAPMLEQVRAWFHGAQQGQEAAQRELATLQRSHKGVVGYANRLKGMLQSERRKRWHDLRDSILAKRLGANQVTAVGPTTVQQIRYAEAVADQTYGRIEPVREPPGELPAEEPAPAQQLKLFQDRSTEHPHQATQVATAA